MPLHSIDVNLVVALRALLRERNVTRAGRAIGLGQSAMSHALARLRAHFDDPLLVPAGRVFVLSERAKALVGDVETASRDLERVFSPRPPFDPRTSDRVLRIVGTDNLALYLLPVLARHLAKAAPKVGIQFHSLASDWPEALAKGDADLKLGRRYRLPPGLRDETVLEERLVCVLRRGHPAARKRLTIGAYAALGHVAIAPTLALGDAYGSAVDEALASRGLTRHVALTVPHFVVAPFVVARLDLVLTAPLRLARTFERSLDLVALAPPVALARYALSQVWADPTTSDDAHVWLRSTIRDVLGAEPPPREPR